MLEVVPPFSITTNLNNLWYIPYTSEQPARAMQVLNEMYTNPDLANIFIYGVEGTHYVMTDSAQGLIDYPEGVDPGSLGYSSDPWMWPNELISHKWSSDGASIWDDTITFNENAVQSPAKGFAWDSTPVANEIVACNTVLAKYRDGLDTGELDPEIAIPRMAAELDAAGIQNILDEKQRQLDEWLADR